ncbi:semaphorin-6A-like isoform X2 [Paroedura picta]|uniref:semaphorin-6A-like isoform X2 n=1 Tax=Paroedura picta TaxID=143630 RepID=UPI00405792CE
MTMRSRIMLLFVTLWNFAGASFPKNANPLSTNFYRNHYFAFEGYGSLNDPNKLFKLDIQKTLIAHRVLYITARNYVYAIELDKEHTKPTILYSNMLVWESDEDQRRKCLFFAKTEEECHNFIKVIVKNKDNELIICGTNAFKPICSYHKVETLDTLGEPFSGRGINPFDGTDHNIALFADGSLYTGTVTNVQATDPVFQRTLGDLQPLRTSSQDYSWLYEPRFIHAVEYGNYIYLFFDEVSMELKHNGKVIIPRVARVCKNDMGGKKVLQKQWTSFLKAQMICSVEGDIPFHFNTLRSVTDVVKINGRDIVVGVFATPKNSIPGSAVCAFDMQDIEKVFAGNFKYQKDYNTLWTSIHENNVPHPRPGSCAGSKPFQQYTSSTEFPDKVLLFMRRHHLMDRAVPSTFKQPWFLTTIDKYQILNIVIDTSAGPKGDQTVAFLGTQEGRVLKVWDRSGNGPLLSKSLFIEEIGIYKHGNSCIASRDPYCVWMTETGECKHFVPGDSEEYEQDLENADVRGTDC